MGEDSAEQEFRVSRYGASTYSKSESHSAARSNSVCLQMFFSDNLICVHDYAFRYNKFKFNSTFEVALMIKNKCIHGDAFYAY
jgi:hypothetical protein